MGIKLQGATSGSIELDVPAAVSGGDVSLTLPNGVGSADQVLQTNGSGTLSWSHLHGPTFKARLSSNQSMSDATWTTAILNNKLWDTDSCFDTSTGRFTPNKAGLYYINAQTYINWTTGSPTRYGVRIYKNGGWIAGDVSTAGANYWGMCMISTLIEFNGTTDYVDMRSYITSVTTGQEMLANYTNMSGIYMRAL